MRETAAAAPTVGERPVPLAHVGRFDGVNDEAFSIRSKALARPIATPGYARVSNRAAIRGIRPIEIHPVQPAGDQRMRQHGI